MHRPPLHGPLVGRADVVTTLLRAIDDPGAGGTVVVGAQGVGKTRLLVDCLARAGRAGNPTARVAATRSASDIPLGTLAGLVPDVGPHSLSALVAARRAIAARSAERRFVLGVDDAHFLDEASAVLLLDLVADRSVFALLTAQAGMPVHDAVAAIWKDNHAERIDLGALDQEDVAQLVVHLLGAADRKEVAPEVFADVWSSALGNPQTTVELVSAALTAGALARDAGTWRARSALQLPTRTPSEPGDEALRALGDDERHALELVALAEPIELAVLERAVDQRVLEHLEERRLLSVHEHAGGIEISLSHPLHSEVVRSGIAEIRRRRLVGELVDALAASPTRTQGDELRLVRWQMEIDAPVDAAAAYNAALRAAVGGDFEAAMRLARESWRGGRVDAAVLLGWLLCEEHRYGECDEVLSEVTAGDLTDGDRVGAALIAAECRLRAKGDTAGALGLLSSAEDLLVDESPVIRARQARYSLFFGDITRARALAEPLLARTDTATLAEVAIVLGTIYTYDGQPVRAIGVLDRALGLLRADGGVEQTMLPPGMVELTYVFALAHAGRLCEAMAFGEAEYARAVRRAGIAQSQIAYALANAAYVQGRPATTRQWLDRASGRSGRLGLGPPRWRRYPLVGRLLAACLAADLELATAIHEELLADASLELSLSRGGLELMAEARFLALQGRIGEALAVLDSLAESIGPVLRTYALIAAHEMARLGHAEEALRWVDRLDGPWEGELLPARIAYIRAVHRRDADELEAVAEQFEAAGADLFAAEAWAGADRALRRDGRGRDAGRARARSQAAASRCEGACSPAMALAGELIPLTEREREVARLAAQGMTSRQVADALGVSVKTVSNHLQRAYEKLGVSGRNELADALAWAGPR